MWLPLIVVCVMSVFAIGVIWLIASWRCPEKGFVGYYVDAVKAMRADRLDTEQFAIEHHDVSINDVFSTFAPYEGDAYLTPEELNAAVSELASNPGVERVKKVADMLKKENHAA
ncbi:hypothetical protein [Arcanobacterium phocae]|uniref:hypothetical protein n=2 Tax=Arcanobacterium phocae TaxID=131112 RepID=UPI001C112839|nr:hypothetical protein [Arcanobacterium phocae]